MPVSVSAPTGTAAATRTKRIRQSKFLDITFLLNKRLIISQSKKRSLLIVFQPNCVPTESDDDRSLPLFNRLPSLHSPEYKQNSTRRTCLLYGLCLIPFIPDKQSASQEESPDNCIMALDGASGRQPARKHFHHRELPPNCPFPGQRGYSGGLSNIRLSEAPGACHSAIDTQDSSRARR